MAGATYIRIHKSELVEGSPTNGNAIYYVEGACVAADESSLPTDGIANGSKFYVVDDGSWIFYDESSEKWVDSSGSPLS